MTGQSTTGAGPKLRWAPTLPPTHQAAQWGPMPAPHGALAHNPRGLCLWGAPIARTRGNSAWALPQWLVAGVRLVLLGQAPPWRHPCPPLPPPLLAKPTTPAPRGTAVLLGLRVVVCACMLPTQAGASNHQSKSTKRASTCVAQSGVAVGKNLYQWISLLCQRSS